MLKDVLEGLKGDIINSDYIKEILDKGFNCGYKYNSDDLYNDDLYDADSVSRLLCEKNTNGEDDFTFLKNWLPVRFDYICEILSSIEIIDGYVHIYRNIFVDDNIIDNCIMGDDALGEFWSYENQYFEGWGDEDLNHLFFHGLVHWQDIDWKTTLLRNMNYVCGEDENELSLTGNVSVSILSVSLNNEDVEVFNEQRVGGNKHSEIKHTF